MEKVQSLEEVLGDNVRAFREARGLSQQALANRMRRLGFSWSHNTSSVIERAQRGVPVAELGALALALGVAPVVLLYPRDPDTAEVAIGNAALMPGDVTHWVRGELAAVLDLDTDGAELRTNRDEGAIALRDRLAGPAKFRTRGGK